MKHPSDIMLKYDMSYMLSLSISHVIRRTKKFCSQCLEHLIIETSLFYGRVYDHHERNKTERTLISQV